MTAETAERVLRKEVVVAAPIADVWRAWTTEDGLRPIAGTCRVDLRPGGDYAWFLDLDPDDRGRRGSEGSSIAAVDPPHRLQFDWNFPPSIPTLRYADATTRVTVTLTETAPDEVTIRLEATGWATGADWDEGYRYFDAAWGAVLDAVRTTLEGTGR